MKTGTIFTWLLIACALAGHAQHDYLKYPDYDLVIRTFFENYSVQDRPNRAQVSNEITFAKKPTGWHVIMKNDFATPGIIKDELFWDLKKKKFREIDFKKLADKTENDEHLPQYLNDWSKEYYRICPYYGYPSWDWDLIQGYKDAPNLPDSILYALGRAYSSYASNLLNNNSGLADSSRQFNLPMGMNSMTEEQLRTYRHYRHEAIKTFMKVKAINPKYETIVGAIGMKAANEHMTSFLDLRVYQNEQEAMKEITTGIYSEFYVAAAKNYLNSCAPNAILFTNGDNDTFPLLYVQSQLGFRPDVLVVNFSLFQTERYINSLREKILGSPALPLSFSAEEIKGSKRELVIVNKGEQVLELDDLIRYVKNDSNLLMYEGTGYYNVPSNKFRLTLGKKTIDWEIKDDYFLRSHLMLLDLLATNKLDRPVYFANTMSNECYFGLDDYLKLEGLAYRLLTEKKSKADGIFGSVNDGVMYDNVLNKFDWTGIQNLASHEKLQASNYRYCLQSLAESLTDEKKPDHAKRILAKSIEMLPNEVLPFSIEMIPAVETFYKLKEFEKGNSLAKQLDYNLNRSAILSEDPAIGVDQDQKDAANKALKDLGLLYDQKEIFEMFNKY